MQPGANQIKQASVFLSAADIRQMQEEKFADLLQHVYANSAFYRKVFNEHNIDINGITLNDLQQFPFTTKDDLAKHNDEFLCVPKSEVADFITTSGTLGDPVTFYLTKNDLERLAYNECVSLQCANVNTTDVVQLTTTIDKQFMAGLAYYLGVQKLGAGIIRTGPGSPYAQWETIKRFSPSVIIAIPSLIPKLISYAIENGIDYKNSSVRSVICIGEPIRTDDFSWNELGKRIVTQWDLNLYSTYASTEMGAAFTECEAGTGGHNQPELLIAEVVDEQGNPVANGQLGEVVITTLGVEGMPLIRYKTGDLCHVYDTPCKCGRHTLRLGPVMGRKQQMIKFKGTTIFPPAVFDVLDMMPQVEIYQVEVSHNEFGNDDITVLLDEAIRSQAFEHSLHSLFKSKLRVTPYIEFINRQELTARVFKEDKRKPVKIVYRERE
jgi:phenylacetate-CoA ligase